MPSAGGAPRFERANRRIYAPPGLHWDGRWTIVHGAQRQHRRALRAAVRKELEWEGYAMLAPGLLAHPAADAEALADMLERVKGAGKIFVCSAAELPAPARGRWANWWRRLGPVRRGGRLPPLHRRVHAAAGDPARRAGHLRRSRRFVVRSLLIHAYRRVQLHDPMLPLELLPQPWPGSEAYALAQSLGTSGTMNTEVERSYISLTSSLGLALAPHSALHMSAQFSGALQRVGHEADPFQAHSFGQIYTLTPAGPISWDQVALMAHGDDADVSLARELSLVVRNDSDTMSYFSVFVEQYTAVTMTAPVPEPATYAMLLAGFVLLLPHLRRRMGRLRG
jgi:DNA-binding transcriptional regulator PaaX